MGVILTLAIVIIALIVIANIVGFGMNLLWTLLVGLVIGAVARLVVPGRQAMGWLATMLAGVAGALLGGLLANQLDLGTIGYLVLAVLTAAVLVAVIGGVGDRGHGRGLDRA